MHVTLEPESVVHVGFLKELCTDNAVLQLTISSSLKIMANTKINNKAVDFDIVYLKRHEMVSFTSIYKQFHLLWTRKGHTSFMHEHNILNMFLM